MLRVIGAGLPRTGTSTLKAALPMLVGGSCYHMTEVFEHPDHLEGWKAVTEGDTDRLDGLLDGYTSAVDWPASAYWPQLAEANPEALIVLSVRDDGPTWWGSMDATVMAQAYRRRPDFAPPEFFAMAQGLWRHVFGELFDDPAAGVKAYDAYLQHVRDTAPAGRLLEWNAKQGWGPLCEALGVPVPEEPLPHLNTREEWARRLAEGVTPGK
ncbi:sulfotransferase family protein [Actinorhabdospora filicis]|uniref:Sulfotransferase family protein n=1 Tax=Actinorhabdospora filicis TaxID=1785913 RepID=A0A9W6SN73_9ACTN|nr:sulfotransferase family protein [Actinorhabdospora filicis]GLZ78857.1 sulfotransferase family protein [Actinorhabdospora filicis]